MDQIPPGQYKYDLRPQFVRWPKDNGAWHIFGWEETLRIGEVVEVEKYSAPADERNGYFEILSHVAERTVSRRNGTKLRFVMCTFDDTVRED